MGRQEATLIKPEQGLLLEVTTSMYRLTDYSQLVPWLALYNVQCTSGEAGGCRSWGERLPSCLLFPKSPNSQVLLPVLKGWLQISDSFKSVISSPGVWLYWVPGSWQKVAGLLANMDTFPPPPCPPPQLKIFHCLPAYWRSWPCSQPPWAVLPPPSILTDASSMRSPRPEASSLTLEMIDIHILVCFDF